MESAASPISFAVGPDEAPELARILDRPGPFVTVMLATDARLDNASHRAQQRWRPVRDDLAAQGAPAGALDAIESRVPDAHLDGEGLFAIADSEGLLLVQDTDAPATDSGRFGDPPYVSPIIEWHQRHLPHILVVADRTGADITAFVAGEAEETATEGTDDSGNPLIRKSAPGGWSQRRYQERAENTWEANAKAAADRIAQVAELIGPRAILTAGDVRAVAYLKEHLHQRWAGLVREVAGSRGADGNDEVMAEDARRQMKTVAAADTVALSEKFREELGQADRAVNGVEATAEALNRAAVETLLVHDDPGDERTVWFAPDQPLAALESSSLRDYGVQEPRQGRLVDVLIRVAFGTGARVRMVPSKIALDGVGALLRFAS